MTTEVPNDDSGYDDECVDSAVSSTARAHVRGYKSLKTSHADPASTIESDGEESPAGASSITATERRQLVVATVWARCRAEALAKGQVALRRFDRRTSVVGGIETIESRPTTRDAVSAQFDEKRLAAVPLETRIGERLLAIVNRRNRSTQASTEVPARGQRCVPNQCDERGTPIDCPMNCSTVSNQTRRRRWLVPGIATLSV
jgi:hypothetical protein